MVGPIALAAMAAAIGNRVIVRAKADYAQGVNLFMSLIADSGARKSEVFRHMAGPLFDLQREERERDKADVQHQRSLREALEKRRERKVAELGAAAAPERGGLEAELREIDTQLAKMRRVEHRQRVADDVTPEAAVSLMAKQHGSISIMSAEGDILDIMAGRYSKNGNPQLGNFLKAHDRDPISSNRITRGEEEIHRPTLTIGVTMQPDALRETRRQPSMASRGMTARFIYALPEERTRTTNDTASVPEAVRATWAEGLRIMASISPVGEDEGGEYVPHEVPISADVLGAWIQWRTRNDVRKSEAGPLAALRSWAEKGSGRIIRIAGLLHVGDHLGDGQWQKPIPLPTFERAVRLMNYFEAHAVAAFALIGENDSTRDARAVMRWLENQGRDTVTVTDMHQGLRHGQRFADRDALLRAIEYLVDIEALDPVTHEPRGGRPGRPRSQAYRVSPRVLDGRWRR